MEDREIHVNCLLQLSAQISQGEPLTESQVGDYFHALHRYLKEEESSAPVGRRKDALATGRDATRIASEAQGLSFAYVQKYTPRNRSFGFRSADVRGYHGQGLVNLEGRIEGE